MVEIMARCRSIGLNLEKKEMEAKSPGNFWFDVVIYVLALLGQLKVTWMAHVTHCDQKYRWFQFSFGSVMKKTSWALPLT